MLPIQQVHRLKKAASTLRPAVMHAEQDKARKVLRPGQKRLSTTISAVRIQQNPARIPTASMEGMPVTVRCSPPLRLVNVVISLQVCSHMTLPFSKQVLLPLLFFLLLSFSFPVACQSSRSIPVSLTMKYSSQVAAPWFQHHR